MPKKTNPTILKEFEKLIVALEAAKQPFFCTGTLPLDADKPIAVLIAEASQGKPSKFNTVYFPLENESEIQPLLDASRQASFGRGNCEVLDPSYHRALVLHKEEFIMYPSGCLKPHGLGILSSIAKTLLPSSLMSPAKEKTPKGGAGEEEDDDGEEDEDYSEEEEDDSKEKDDDRETRIIAHLDKLNVYTEGDFFKAHVDTPRSPDMFGTLLINLPVKHEGGQLVVRAPISGNGSAHTKRDEYTTAWGDDSNLEWIAFFSDCEHEVLPVTSGNR